MLTEPDEDILDVFGCDFVMLPIETLPLGLEYGGWREYTFWDGQTFMVPAGFEPKVNSDGSLDMPQTKGGERIMRMVDGGRFFDRIPGTEGDIFDVEHIPESEWNFSREFSDEFLRKEESKAGDLHASTDRALVAHPPVGAPQGYGGTYYWATKMLTEPSYCHDYMAAAGEAASHRFTQYLEAVGSYIDVIVISGSDYGGQNREMFDPDLFKEHYVPAWQQVTDTIHRFPNVKTWVHSCGAVGGFIPHFIEAGVDILNPVQWTANGMELETLKSKYGANLCFWGGATSTQRTFPFGTPDDVARETTEILELMTPGGGFVVNPIHNILPEVPVENIITMYHTARSFGAGPSTARDVEANHG